MWPAEKLARLIKYDLLSTLTIREAKLYKLMNCVYFGGVHNSGGINRDGVVSDCEASKQLIRSGVWFGFSSCFARGKEASTYIQHIVAP